MSVPAYQMSGNLSSDLPSLVGTGLGIYNQGQQYSQLQSALNTIGPTNLQGWNLGGPGGMSSGFNPATGGANINLGSLNPAFSGFAGAAGAGANSYNAQLPSFLSGNALSTLNPAMATLGSAYGNYGAGMGAANAQLGNLGNFNTNYNNLLQAQYGQLAPQIQQNAFGLQNTLFGNGVADSTGAASGSLAAQNFGRGVGQAQSTAQLNAFQQALAQQNSAAQNYGALTNSANGILSNAFNNFGNTNQLISGLNTAGLTNATTATQGAGALNTLGLNNYNAALQTGTAQGTVRNQSLFPYASVATALSQTPTAMGLGASALTQMGANGGFNIPGLNSSNIGQLYNSMFGGGTSGLASTYGSGAGSAFNGAFDSAGFNAAQDPAFSAALSNDPTYLSALQGFNTAGGGAAGAGADAGLGAQVASDAQTTGGAAFDAYSASAGADAAGGADASGAAAAGGGAGLGLAAGGIAAAGLLGMDALFNHNSEYNRLGAYNTLMQSATGADPASAAAFRSIAQQELAGGMPLPYVAGQVHGARSGNQY